MNYEWALHLGALCDGLRDLWYIQEPGVYEDLRSFITSGTYRDVLAKLGYRGKVCETFELQTHPSRVFGEVQIYVKRKDVMLPKDLTEADMARLLRYCGSYEKVLALDTTGGGSTFTFDIFAEIDDDSFDLMTYRCLREEVVECTAHTELLLQDWKRIFPSVTFSYTLREHLNQHDLLLKSKSQQVLTEDEFHEALNIAWNAGFFEEFPDDMPYTREPFALGILWGTLAFSENDPILDIFENIDQEIYAIQMKTISGVLHTAMYTGRGSFHDGVAFFAKTYTQYDPATLPGFFSSRSDKKKYNAKLADVLETLLESLNK